MAIDLNSAAAEELQTLPGIGAKTAQAIIAHRPFESLDDLIGVPGIGRDTISRLSSLVAIVRPGREIPGTRGAAGEWPGTRSDVVQLRLRRGPGGPELVWILGESATAHPFREPFTDSRTVMLNSVAASTTPEAHNPGTLRQVGAVLYPSLLGHQPIRHALALAGVHAGDRGEAPTVQLLIDRDAIESAHLPWELVHDGKAHLLRDDLLRFDRRLLFFGDRASTEPVERLGILYVSVGPIAAPDANDTRDRIRTGFAPLLDARVAEMTFLENPAFDAFGERIRSGSYSIVHFDGYGGFDDGPGLTFPDGEGNSEFVPADRIAEALAGRGVRLVVLGACRGSAERGTGIVNSIALALMGAGIPAVIGNQFTIRPDALLAFNEALYASLARGGSLSDAVARARAAMRDTGDQWFLPVLYLLPGAGEGYLFGEEPEEHSSWRDFQIRQLASWWWQMPEEERRRHPEGLPTVDGAPVVLSGSLLLSMGVASQLEYLDYLSSLDASPFWERWSTETRADYRRLRQMAETLG
jgi:competence ComEA-like helix-hairpin-helix protein